MVLASCSDTSQCLLEIVAYDHEGNRLNGLEILRFTPREAPERNLLTTMPRKIRIVGGSQVDIDRQLLGQVALITVKHPKSGEIAQPVFLMQCSQRVSLRIGEASAYGDVTFDTLKGRVTGCSFEGDWWIRATSMFGQYFPPAALEARVEKDGTFHLSGPMAGERYIIVIGKEKTPVKAIGTNIISGSVNDIGTLDLSASCPP